MRAVTYRSKETGEEYTPPVDTYLAEVFHGSAAWEPVGVSELMLEPPADDDERGGADTGTAPEFAAVYDPGEPGRTYEEVNDYLDTHPEAVELVLQLEAEGKARKGILHGRHGTPEPEAPAAPAAPTEPSGS